MTEQRRRWRLAQRFGAGGDITIDAEEAALVQRLITRIYGPAVTGPACDLLDGQ
ncbi:hypothetical protein V5F79_17540 [Xanthobacter flavus]|uniref:hypothetical protein n=1 Tax=Xanthobacter flavus TaxID=281 RepID=UPI0037295021